MSSCMLHCSDTWPVKKQKELTLQRAEIRMISWMCGIKVTDRFTFVFQHLPEPNRACLVGVYTVTLDPLLSLYGIIYVTWYTRPLSKPTGVRFRQLSVYQVT